jgi:hypothetical protein
MGAPRTMRRKPKTRSKVKAAPKSRSRPRNEADPLPIAFKGRLEVDGDFDLIFDRLIFRDGHIHFDLGGHEEYGNYRMEGNAFPAGNGSYVSGYVPYTVGGSKKEIAAKIEFKSLLRRRTRLNVVGIWHEGGQEHDFKGALRAFDPVRQGSRSKKK